MQIANYEDFIKTLRPDITVFDEQGKLTNEAINAYDALIDILTYLASQNVINRKELMPIINRLDNWSNDVLNNEY